MNSGSMIIARVIAMLLLLSFAWCCVLAIPYTLRMLTHTWAGPLLHGGRVLTGMWVGVLEGPAESAPDLTPGPALTERNRVDSLRDYETRKATSKAAARAILITTRLNFFYIGSARLTGTAQTCDAQGRTEEFRTGSSAVTDTSMQLELYDRQDPQAGGSLRATREGDMLAADYLSLSAATHGELARGAELNFQSLCQHLQNASTH